MKEKYIVKESNGWWYEGKFYIEGSPVELTQNEYTLLKVQVNLLPAVKK